MGGSGITTESKRQHNKDMADLLLMQSRDQGAAQAIKVDRQKGKPAGDVTSSEKRVLEAGKFRNEFDG